jgi:hypothetical protein
MCEEKAMPLTTRLNEKCRAKPSKVGGHFWSKGLKTRPKPSPALHFGNHMGFTHHKAQDEHYHDLNISKLQGVWGFRVCAPIYKHNFPLDLNELQDSSSFISGILKDTNVACAVVSPSVSSIPK